MLKWTGYSKDELLKLSFWDITPRSYEAQELAQIDELNQTGRCGPSNKEYIRRDGSRFPIRLSGFKSVDQDGTPIVWGIIDNLELLPTKGQVEPSVAGLDHLNILFDAICMVDESGSFVFVSQAAERIFGYAPEEMIGKRMIDFVYADDVEQTLKTANRVMTGDLVNHFENRYLRKDGRLVDILWSARWSNVDRLRIAVARDITERKRSEKRLLTLYNISEAANQATDLQSFLKQLDKILVNKLGNADLMVVLRDPKTDELRLVEPLDAQDSHARHINLPPERLCREVIRSGNLLRLEGDALKQCPDYSSLAMGDALELWIGVPMSEAGKCLGLLVIKGYQTESTGHKIDDDFLVYVSNQIALVVERLELQEALRQKAMYDVLTRLPNRALFNDSVTASMNRVKREGKKMALMFVDVNDLKWVNDTYGHAAGDLLLQTIGDRLSASIRASDTVARIGGDEFVCLFEGDLTEESVATLTTKIRSRVDGWATINDCTLAVSVSLGTAIFPDHGESIDALMSFADNAMYADKARIKKMGHARKNNAT